MYTRNFLNNVFDCVSLSVQWMKGIQDITNSSRTYKEVVDDYIRLIMKRTIPSDEGTYCILVKNAYGCEKAFYYLKVKAIAIEKQFSYK